MRTSEERARLIQRRTAEIKQERRIKRQRRLDAACMAACLFLVIGIGALMPGLMRKPCRAGLYRDGAVGIFPWGLRDGSSIPSASEM